MSAFVLYLIIWGIATPVALYRHAMRGIERAHDSGYKLGVKHGRSRERDDQHLQSARAAYALGMAMFKAQDDALARSRAGRAARADNPTRETN
jgi:ribosome modulation factor